MLNPLNFLDPIMLTMKLRDSFRSGDNAHVQNYIQDTLANSLSSSRNKSSTAQSGDSARVSEQVNRSVNQYLEQMKSMPGISNFSGIQDYIIGIIQQSLNNSLGNSLGMPISPIQNKSHNTSDTRNESKISENNNNPEVFETHYNVLVKLKVPKNINGRNIKVYTSSNKVFIKWSPVSREQVIPLPADVKKEGIKAVLKNRILELTIPKEQNIDSRQVDIEIT